MAPPCAPASTGRSAREISTCDPCSMSWTAPATKAGTCSSRTRRWMRTRRRGGTNHFRPAESRIFPWAPRCRTQATGGNSMRRIFGIAGIAAMVVFAAACNSAPTTSSNTPAKSAYTFYMVTHGDNGTFWSVLQKGEKQAAADLGVTVNYQGSNNDDAQECQFISAAVTAKPDGLAVSPHSQTVLDCAKQPAARGL